MSCIHYKFKSFLEYKTLTFDGLHISVGDLKREIHEKEKIGSQGAFDLQLTNAQTKRVYKEDNELIPRNSSVTVARIPAVNQQKLPKIQDRSSEGVVTNPKVSSDTSGIASASAAMFADRAELANSSLTEEEKVEEMKRVSTIAYDRSKYVHRNSLMTGPPPPTYVCNKCHKTGHWIKNCPLAATRRTTGMMRSELMETTADDPQAYLTPAGKYVVPILHREAYLKGKKERTPFLDDDSAGVDLEEEPKLQIPSELLCNLCEDLLKDAVMILCCGDSFCDECIRSRLLETADRECPHCQEKGVNPYSSLVPNSKLRQAVVNFQNETGYSHYKNKKQHQQRLKFSIPSSAAVTHAPVTLAPPLQALLNRYMSQPIKQSASTSSTPPAGASPQQASDSPVLVEPEKPLLEEKVLPPPAVSSSCGPPVSASVQYDSQPSSQSQVVTQSVHPVPFVAPAPVHRPPLAAITPIQVAPVQPFRPQAPPIVRAASVVPPGVSYQRHPPSSFVAPPGVTPPPVSTVQPKVSTSFTSQPPPPGLVALQPQPPGVFGGDTGRFRGGESDKKPSERDAWDEYLARKDRKKKQSSSSSSSSSSSESSSYSSRSRSRTKSRSRSRDRLRRRRHARSYSRSRSRSRSRTPPRRRRRTRSRSPRTPSPDWVAAAAAASGSHPMFRKYVPPYRFDRNRRRRRSPLSSGSDWYFYAGGSKRPPPHAHFLQNLAAASAPSRPFQPHHEVYNQTFPYSGNRSNVNQQYFSGGHGGSGFPKPPPTWTPAVVPVPRAHTPLEDEAPEKTEEKSTNENRKEHKSPDKSSPTDIWMVDHREGDNRNKKEDSSGRKNTKREQARPERKVSKSPGKKRVTKDSSDKKKSKTEGEEEAKKKRKGKKEKPSSSTDGANVGKETEKDHAVKRTVSTGKGSEKTDLKSEEVGSVELVQAEPSVKQPTKEARKEKDGAPRKDKDSKSESPRKRKSSGVPIDSSKQSKSSKKTKRSPDRSSKKYGNGSEKTEKGKVEKGDSTATEKKDEESLDNIKAEVLKEVEKVEIKDTWTKKTGTSSKTETEVHKAEKPERADKVHKKGKTRSPTSIEKVETKRLTNEETKELKREEPKKHEEKNKLDEPRQKIKVEEAPVEKLKDADVDSEKTETEQNKKHKHPELKQKESKKKEYHGKKLEKESKESKRKSKRSSLDEENSEEVHAERKERTEEKSEKPVEDIWPSNTATELLVQPLAVDGKSKSRSSEERRECEDKEGKGDDKEPEVEQKTHPRPKSDRESSDSKKEKKEKKKKKKKNKEGNEHKKKHKKDKVREKERERHKTHHSRGSKERKSVVDAPESVTVETAFHPVLTQQVHSSESYDDGDMTSASKPGGIKMQVQNPARTMIASKWETDSSDMEEEEEQQQKVQLPAPVRSVKERLGAKKELQPLHQYQHSTLSPKTIAKAEQAIFQKLRKPPGGLRAGNSLVVTAERQERRVSLEGELQGKRRVVNENHSLSVTVGESNTFPSRNKDSATVPSKDRRKTAPAREGWDRDTVRKEDYSKSFESGVDVSSPSGGHYRGSESSSSRPVKLKRAWKSPASNTESDSKS